MNEFDSRLKQQAEPARFSADRHEKLVASLGNAPSRTAESPLSSGSKTWVVTGTLAIVVIGAMFAWQSRSSPSLATHQNGEMLTHDFGAPMRVAERSMSDAGDAAARLNTDPTRPLLEPADEAFRFVVDRFSLAGSLAVAAQKKPA